jgi:hypothetical protein
LILIRELPEFERRIYPSLQIFGGGMLLLNFFNQAGTGADALSLWVLGVLAVGGLAGALFALWWFDQKPRAAACCCVFWALQALMFASPLATYSFFSGAQFPLTFEPAHLSLSLHLPRLGVQFVARDEQDGPAAYVGVNLVALAAAWFFFKAWRTAKRSPMSPV